MSKKTSVKFVGKPFRLGGHNVQFISNGDLVLPDGPDVEYATKIASAKDIKAIVEVAKLHAATVKAANKITELSSDFEFIMDGNGNLDEAGIAVGCTEITFSEILEALGKRVK